MEEGRADFVTKRISRVQNGTPLPTTSNLARLIIIFIEISDTTRTKLIGLSIIPPPLSRKFLKRRGGEKEREVYSGPFDFSFCFMYVEHAFQFSF